MLFMLRAGGYGEDVQEACIPPGGGGGCSVLQSS